MTLIKKNIIANLAGNIWSAIMSLAFIPIYIHFMGIESYALIGIYIALMAVSVILDMGMSETISREMARLMSHPDKAQESINLVRTMEALIWVIAVFVGLLTFLLANPIAYHWVNPDALPVETVRQAILLMGFSMIFQWPCSFYSSGFIGLQKQVLLNVITASMATLRGAGVILILWLVSPTIQAFFIWQIVVSVLQFFISVTLFKKNLPNTGKRAVFQFSLVSNLWRFAVGMGGISILGMLWSQMDKIILSKIETLENLGYYTLALVVATSFSRLMGPVVTALYPRFNQLIVLEQMEELKKLYHKGCQVMSVLIMPFTFLLVFFSEEIILLWTQDPVTAEKTWPLVAVLAVGTMFNGLLHIPLGLQYAHGKTRLVFYSMVVAVVIMAPGIYLATRHFGILGAAMTITTINIVHPLIIIPYFAHNRLYTEAIKDWYIKDIGIPLLISLTVMGIGSMLVNQDMSTLGLILSLTAIMATTVLAVSYSVPIVRHFLTRNMVNILKKNLI